jgi:hypothetical protein
MARESASPVPASAAGVVIAVEGAVVGLLSMGFTPQLALGIVTAAGAVSVGLCRSLIPAPPGALPALDAASQQR